MKLRAYVNFLAPSQRVIVKDAYSYLFMGSAMACKAEKSLWDREVLGTKIFGDEIEISLRVRARRGIINGQ